MSASTSDAPYSFLNQLFLTSIKPINMKLKILAISLLLSATLFNAGCKKDQTDDPDASSLQAGQSQISCTVSGATSSSFNSSTLISTAAKSSDLMNIAGSAVSGVTAEIVMMILPANIAVGTYSSAGSGSDLFTITYSKGGDGWASDSDAAFTVVVTKVSDTEIEGTFSGTMKNDDQNTTVTVTDGKFAAKF
jgi:hypothetical protein